MNCHYCDKIISPPFARYGDHVICGFCSSQIEHQHMVTLGEYTLRIEKIDGKYFIDNTIGTLEFKVVQFFEFWRKYGIVYVKIVKVWFLDDTGYLWTGTANIAKIPGSLHVFRYHRKVFGCMSSIDSPIARDYQPGDSVVFQVDGSKKKIPGTVSRYSDKLRMYAVQPARGRAFLAPEKYLSRIPTDHTFHYADAEVKIDGVLAWRGCTFRKPTHALQKAALNDPRIRGLAQRFKRIKLDKSHMWDGMSVVISRVGPPHDCVSNISEVDINAPAFRIS